MSDREPIVASSEVRRKIGWDGRHEAMADRIIEEFKLKLPRDRELIRQLALIRIQQGQRSPLLDFHYDPHENEDDDA